MNIIRESKHVWIENYSLEFASKDMPGSGFSFPCDKQGNILMDEMHPIGQENLEKCLRGEYEVFPPEVKDYSHYYLEHAQGRCSCGRIVELFGFTNSCDCGYEYNMSGQLLAPRSQWDPRGEY